MGKNLGYLIDDYRNLTQELDSTKNSLAEIYGNAPSPKTYYQIFKECTATFKKVVNETSVLLDCVSSTLEGLEGQIQNLEKESENLAHTINLQHEAGRRRYVGRRILIKNTAYFENVEASENWPVYQRDVVMHVKNGNVTIVPVNASQGITSELSDLKLNRPENFDRALQVPMYEHGHFSETPANPWLCKRARTLTNGANLNLLRVSKSNDSLNVHRSRESILNVSQNDSMTFGGSSPINVPHQTNEYSSELQRNNFATSSGSSKSSCQLPTLKEYDQSCRKSSFISPSAPRPPPTNAPPCGPPTPPPMIQSNSTLSPMSPASPRSQPQAKSPETYLYQARVIYDYEKAEEDELTVFEGYVVNVFRVLDDGWMYVEYDGECGLIPGNYCEEL